MPSNAHLVFLLVLTLSWNMSRCEEEGSKFPIYDRGTQKREGKSSGKFKLLRNQPSAMPPPTRPPSPRYGGGDDCNICQETQEGFQFCLDFNRQMPTYVVEQAILSSVRWERFITGDLDDISIDDIPDEFKEPRPEVCPCGLPERIDDLYVCVRNTYIDGFGGFIGFAGPTLVRSKDNTSVLGYVRLDEDDIGSLNPVLLDETIAHEYGHTMSAIAFSASLLNEDETEYTGKEGTRVWQEEWGCEGNPPVERRGGHWLEDCLTLENMTPFSGVPAGTPEPISRLTMAAMIDHNYTVDLNVAAEVEPEEFINHDVCCKNMKPGDRRLGGSSPSLSDAREPSSLRSFNKTSLRGSNARHLTGLGSEQFNHIEAIAMKHLRDARDRAPTPRDNGVVKYVADLRIGALIMGDDGKLRTINFSLDD